jgi:hypothetical protein
VKPTFFKGAVLGAATSMLVLVATTALAGTGVGAVFNLGKTNSVNKKTILRGHNAGPHLLVKNSAADGVGLRGSGGKSGVSAKGGLFGMDSAVGAVGAVGIRSTAGVSANDAVQGNTSNPVGDAFQGVASGSAAFGVFAITSGGGAGVVSSSGPGTAVSAGNSSATNATVTASNGTASGTAGSFRGDTALNVETNGTFGAGVNATVTGDTDGNGTADDDGNDAIIASSDDTNNSAVITATTAAGSTELSHEAIETFGFLDVNGNARVTGNLDVIGTCCGPLIDNPLDPANSYLRHASVASPDMKNMYDGIVTTDGGARAVVKLPAYFGALNKDFRYQLTIIGGSFAQAIVSKEIPAGGRTFEIRTNKPNVKVSWQVTGTRNDAYAQAHPLQVIEPKTGAAAGMYLHPELFGYPSARPLGLDLPKPANSNRLAVLRAQAELLALTQEKAAQARKEARQGN